jgi:hypothetical protein
LTIGGQVAGQIIGLILIQDAVGGRVVTYPSNIVGASQPDPGATVVSVQLFKVDAALNLNAVGPLVSVNGAFFPALLTANAITLAGGAPNGQVLTGNGSSYVPQTAPGYTSGSNANGFWQKDPSGLIRQWGTVAGAATGNAINFPVPFTNAASVVVSTTSLWYGPGNSICFVVVSKGSVTTLQFEVALGVGSPQDFTWMAVGY